VAYLTLYVNGEQRGKTMHSLTKVISHQWKQRMALNGFQRWINMAQ